MPLDPQQVKQICKKIDAVFDEGGILSQLLPNYQVRKGQKEIAKQYVTSFADSRHFMCEAPTGTGKSLAYLVPMALIGTWTATTFVVSTATKTLQSQLYTKDLPLVKRVIEKLEDTELRYAIIKGRSNYVCLNKLMKLELESSPLFKKIHKLNAKDDNWVGDIEDIPHKMTAEDIDSITSDSDACLGKKCQHYGSCYYEAVKKRINDKTNPIHIVVVNHSLFFANIKVGEESGGFAHILPITTVSAVFDEAHSMADYAAGFLASRISTARIRRWIADYEKGTKWSSVVNQVNVSIDSEVLNGLRTLKDEYLTCFHALFSSLGGKYEDRVRIRPQHYNDCNKRIGRLVSIIGNVLRLADTVLEDAKELFKESGDLLEKWILRGEDIESTLRTFVKIDAERKDTVYWIEGKIKNEHFIYGELVEYPLDIEAWLNECLFSKAGGVLSLYPIGMLSATLRINKRWDWIQTSLGVDAEHCDTMVAPDVFDYEKQSYFFLPEQEYKENEKGELLIKLINASKGSALVLFASYAEMKKMHQYAQSSIKAPVYMQGQLGKNELYAKFKSEINSVLFATASFWEGIDVQGESLINLIIDKIPFSVPTDPEIEGRSEYIQSKGGNPFMQFYLPTAILKIRQGVGRLIRTTEDWGLITILDNRIHTKPYGKLVLASLPEEAVWTLDSDKAAKYLTTKLAASVLL